ARIEAIAPLSGPTAAGARPGRRLGSSDVDVGGGEVRIATVVTLGSAVALDLYDGTRRVARTPVRGADGRGRLVALTGGKGSVRVRWRNPRGARVDRAFRV